MVAISRSSEVQSPVDMACSNEAASLACYNDMIRECIKLGDVKQSEVLLNDMEAFGVKPDLLSFNLVLNTYASDGNVEKAAGLLSSMLDRQIEPNDVTYATVCKVMAVKGLVAQIDGLMQILRQRKVSLNVYFYGALISACGRCEPPDVLTAERAFKEMVLEGLRPQSVKKSLARVVGVTRASALISNACQNKALTEPEKVSMEALTIKSSSTSPSLDSPAYISPMALDCRMGARMNPMMSETCNYRPALIRMSF